MVGDMGPGLTGFASLEQPWGELAEVVPPVDPGVAAAADADLVLDAVLVEHFRQALRASQREVLVTGADREQLLPAGVVIVQALRGG